MGRVLASSGLFRAKSPSNSFAQRDQLVVDPRRTRRPRRVLLLTQEIRPAGPDIRDDCA